MRDAAFADQVLTVGELTELRRAADALVAPGHFDDLHAIVTQINIPAGQEIHQRKRRSPENVDTAGHPATTVRSAPTELNRPVDIVHTLSVGSDSRAVRLLRIPHVFGSSKCLQGLEYSSSPTSGTAYPLVRGVFALTC